MRMDTCIVLFSDLVGCWTSLFEKSDIRSDYRGKVLDRSIECFLLVMEPHRFAHIESLPISDTSL